LKELDDGNRLLRDEVSVFLKEAKTNRAVLDFLRLQRQVCPEGLGLRGFLLADAASLRVEFEGAARGVTEQDFLEKLEIFQRALEADKLVKQGSVKMNQIQPAKAEDTDKRAFRGEATLDPWGAGAEVGE
jgi:hypothetical protein